MAETDDLNVSNAVAVKMPQFLETAPAAWFSILEANFHIKKITIEETKFFHLIAALPPEIVAKIGAKLEDKNCKSTKETVINIYERTKPELFSKLINETTMSGRPSHYLQELTSIANKVGVSEDLVRHQFINALPSSILPVVAAQKELTVQQLGTLADELTPFFTKSSVLQVSDHNQSVRQKTRPSCEIQANARPLASNTELPHGLKPFHERQRPKICRAHIYYAEFARTCKPWCKFPGNRKKCQMLPNSRSSSPSSVTSDRAGNQQCGLHSPQLTRHFSKSSLDLGQRRLISLLTLVQACLYSLLNICLA